MVNATRIQQIPLERARASLSEAGLSIAEWARANGFSVATTKAVLYGNNKGTRGESHRVAIALGIKTGVIVSAKGFQPVRRIKPALKAVRGGK